MSDYSFNGIQPNEAQDRISDMASGVPSQGAGQVILAAPPRRSASVHVVNTGDADVILRLLHGQKDKTQTNEQIQALAASSTHYVGKVQYKSIVPGTVSITNAGAPLTIVDDGLGGLYDTGFVGVAASKRGTVNYVTGQIDFTYGAGPTKPVRATYHHTDYTDFLSSTVTDVVASTATPQTIQLTYGRVAPGTVAFADTNPLTYVDDGKGNIIEITAGQFVKRGTIDYGTGTISLASASAGPAGNYTITYKWNPFASVLKNSGGCKLLDVFNMIPELTGAAWGGGIKGESLLGLFAESRASRSSAVRVQWAHYGEEPFRVTELYSSVQPGGEINDPNLIPTIPTSHL